MITASNTTMRYGKKVLFEDVSVTFNPNSRYGLIGANGSGKSTFMKILTGQEEASGGVISIGADETIGYLKQDHYGFDNCVILDTVYQGNEKLWKLHVEREELYSKDVMTDEEGERAGDVEEEFGIAGGYTMETDAAKLLIGLGIPEDKHEKELNVLSGGFKLRVLLAQALFGEPEVLLLDEPTNHLDMATIDWLVNFLKRQDSTIIVISHNRYFLNQVCTDIADLDYQEMRMFPGNYDDFMIANEMILERIRKQNAKKEKRVSELKDFINRFSANASKSKQASSRKKELNKIEVDVIKPSTRVSPYIRFESLSRLGDKVIIAKDIAKTYELELFKDLDLSINPKEKIGIIGVNGSGKTTLLKILAKLTEPDVGSVTHGETLNLSYFPQDASDVLIGDDTTCIDWLRQYIPEGENYDEPELRSAMGRMLFKGEDVNKDINVLSGGEKARLIISRMLLESGNALFLDEPTNHLDLESIESLNYALTQITNPIVFVSHDREFVTSLATRIIEVSHDAVIDFPGTLVEYEDWKKKQK